MEIILQFKVSLVDQRTDWFFEPLTELNFLLANQGIHVFLNAFLFLKSLTDFLSSFFVVCFDIGFLNNNCIIFINGNVQGLVLLFLLRILFISLQLFILVNASLHFLWLRDCPLLMQFLDLNGNIGWFWWLHDLYVWEADYLVVKLLWKPMILFNQLIKLLLLFRIDLEIINKHLWVLFEHILNSVSYLLLVSVNATDKLHSLKLL